MTETTVDCNSIFGCHGAGIGTATAAAEAQFCTCQRNCEASVGEEVCASDGLVYSSHCHMLVEACQQDVHLEVMPAEYCQTPNGRKNFLRSCLNWCYFPHNSGAGDCGTGCSVCKPYLQDGKKY